MLKNRQGRPRNPRLNALGADGEYRKCGKCDSCKTGTGRYRNPKATDCWVDYLNAAVRPVQRSA